MNNKQNVIFIGVIAAIIVLAIIGYSLFFQQAAPKSTTKQITVNQKAPQTAPATSGSPTEATLPVDPNMNGVVDARITYLIKGKVESVTPSQQSGKTTYDLTLSDIQGKAIDKKFTAVEGVTFTVVLDGQQKSGPPPTIALGDLKKGDLVQINYHIDLRSPQRQGQLVNVAVLKNQP